MSINHDAWLQIAKPYYPNLTDEEIIKLIPLAATKWAFSDSSEIAKIYEQYIMLRSLKGNYTNGN